MKLPSGQEILTIHSCLHVHYSRLLVISTIIYNMYVILTYMHLLWALFLCFVFSQLVNTGVLTTRDIGSWWLSVPGAGIFMKNFSNGKATLL